MNSHLRPVVESDLARLLEWRNHEKNKSMMLTQSSIEYEDHLKWFERTQAEGKKLLLVYEEMDEPVGHVNFSGSRADQVVEWGFYTSPYAPKGTGLRMGAAALKLAFNQYKFHKICGAVLAYNTASLVYHERLGFLKEGEQRDQIQVGTQHVNLIHFGLLRIEWLHSQEESNEQSI